MLLYQEILSVIRILDEAVDQTVNNKTNNSVNNSVNNFVVNQFTTQISSQNNSSLQNNQSIILSVVKAKVSKCFVTGFVNIHFAKN